MSEFIDYVAGERYLYRYDLAGRVESICCYYLNGNSIVMTDKIAQTFDANNRLTSVQYIHKLGSSTYNYTGSYVYDLLGRVTQYSENGFVSAYYLWVLLVCIKMEK